MVIMTRKHYKKKKDEYEGSVSLGQRHSESDERPECEGGAAHHGHAHQPLPLHLALDDGLQVLRLTVARLNLQQRANVLERRVVLLDARVADGQVVQVVALALILALTTARGLVIVTQ